METEIKYLSDGRKVAVIGSINQTEFIVQEIYVTDDGDELPSGEKFTSKNLLDMQAKTYKEKELDRIDVLLNEKKKELEKIRSSISEDYQKRLASAELTKQSIKSMEAIPNFDFNHLIDVVSGNIKHVVPIGYDGMSIKKHKDFDNSMTYFDRYGGTIRFDGIKLLSLIGKSNGNLDFSISRYGDGSGGSEEVIFLKNNEELKSHYLNTIIKRHDAGKVSIGDIEICSEYIKVPNYIIDSLYMNQIKHQEQIHAKELKSMEERHVNNKERLNKILDLKLSNN